MRTDSFQEKLPCYIHKRLSMKALTLPCWLLRKWYIDGNFSLEYLKKLVFYSLKLFLQILIQCLIVWNFCFVEWSYKFSAELVWSADYPVGVGNSVEESTVLQVKNTGYEALEEALIRERLQQKNALDATKAKEEKIEMPSESKKVNPVPNTHNSLSEKRFQTIPEAEKQNSSDNSKNTKEEGTRDSPNASNTPENKQSLEESPALNTEKHASSNDTSSISKDMVSEKPVAFRSWFNRASHWLGDTIEHVRQVALIEDGFLSNVRFPTRKETVALLSQFTLIVALILLLRAGVNRTLRWVHARIDPNSGQLRYEQSVFECMQRPLEFLAVSTVITSVAEFVSRPLAATGLLKYIRPLRELVVIFSATWFLLRWIERIRSRFMESSTYDARVNKAQVDALSRVMTVAVSGIALLISLDTFGINIQTVLAFGGIGGVAIGFAGREIISNFFGGFMIYLTQPFAVGDWVRSIENEQIDGSVEEIGWYLTRIRTWEKRPLYIPNSRFSTLVVENPSRMTNRRIKHTIGLAMEDMCVIKNIIRDIQTLLDLHPELDPKQHRMVWFDGFGEYSVNIWLSCYTKTVFLGEFRRVQQEILFSVYNIIRSHHARLASSVVRDLREGSDPDKYAPYRSFGQNDQSQEYIQSNNGTNSTSKDSSSGRSRHEHEGTSVKPVSLELTNASEDGKKEMKKESVASSSQTSPSGTMRIKGPGGSNVTSPLPSSHQSKATNSAVNTNNNNNNNNATGDSPTKSEKNTEDTYEAFHTKRNTTDD
eukprot:jgi/Galph1/5856/GphlegSOOS_G4440.1